MRWLDGITNSMGMSLRVGDGQGGLECCSARGRKELDTTELNSIEGWWKEKFVLFWRPDG